MSYAFREFPSSSYSTDPWYFVIPAIPASSIHLNREQTKAIHYVAVVQSERGEITYVSVENLHLV